MLMTPGQQQKLFLLHDEPGRHTLPRPAQHQRSWEHLMQTSRAADTDESKSFLCFDVPLRTWVYLWIAGSLPALVEMPASELLR